MVEYYGAPTPLTSWPRSPSPEPRLLQVQPWDKNTLGAIEKAIQKSELGFNPTNDGKVIRIAVPPLTEQRRRELVKLVKHHVEEAGWRCATFAATRWTTLKSWKTRR